MTVLTFPPTGRFEAVLESAKRQPTTERFTLTGGFDCYRIWENGSLISTFHGAESLSRAHDHLRRLKEGLGNNPDPTPQEVVRSMLRASVEAGREPEPPAAA